MGYVQLSDLPDFLDDPDGVIGRFLDRVPITPIEGRTQVQRASIVSAVAAELGIDVEVHPDGAMSYPPEGLSAAEQPLLFIIEAIVDRRYPMSVSDASDGE